MASDSRSFNVFEAVTFTIDHRGLLRNPLVGSPDVALCCNFRVHANSSKLVDPASDHILRSKTKPCMSKTKQVVSESAYGSLNEPSPPREQSNNWITVVIQGLIMRQ